MVSSNGIGRLAARVVICAAVLGGAVACGPGDQATLTITDPADGAVLTLATDTQPDVAGVQANVVVAVHLLAVGEQVTLSADNSVIGTQMVPDSDTMTFDNVTIPSGTHTLAAFTSSGVRSNEVSVTVNDGCATIDYVTPMPGSDRVTLGPNDDTDGTACGESFQTTVTLSTDAGDGAQAQVFVNGNPQGTANVSGTTLRFQGVSFDIGSTANQLEVKVTNSDGVVCPAPFPVPIYVDCAGVSCRFTMPSSDTGFLNSNDASPDMPGFQGNFEVTTDADGAGQPIQLIIDGNETDAMSQTPMATGMEGVATFGNVSLSEGVHRIQAVCSDAAGNKTRTSAEWTVDTIPCDVTVAAPTDGQLFIDSDDIDTSTDGIQIDMNGSASGDACTMYREGTCGSLPDFQTLTGNSFDGTVTLGTSASQDLCAEVQDQAGNVGSGMVTVRVRSNAPQLQIVTPATGAAFNAAGTGGRTADLDASSTTCEAAFSVYCTDVGSAVTLIDDSGTMFGGGSATCTADSTAPSPYMGTATFASVSLPSEPALAEVHVRARQAVDGLVGLSDPITVLSDCDAPVLTLSQPTCGSILRPIDDEDASTPGIQYTVIAVNTNVPKPPVSMELRDGSGATIFGPVVSSIPASGVQTTFAGTTFMVGGNVVVHACATDAAGNLGCAPDCMVSVQDIPTLSISQPAPGAILTVSDDCDSTTAGLQVSVRATTDAADGSAGTMQIGTGTVSDVTVSGGTMSACVDAPDGRNLVVAVSVTDSARGTATASLRVNVDTMPPTDAISDLTVTEADRRRGTATFSWTAVNDAGGTVLDHYVAHCSSAPITTESDWTAATSVTIMATPAMGGATQSAGVSGFRPGQPRYCVLRGADIAGALTPLPGTPAMPFAPTLLQEEITGVGNLGVAVEPVGDINDDGIDDVLVGALDGHVYLYFGSSSSTPLSGTPDVTISGPTSGAYGRILGTLGDVNGDGRPDFAISAPIATVSGVSSAGTVWVLFGRSSTSPWPSSLSLGLTSASCGADLCFFGTVASALLGNSPSSAGDFDGDGFGDFSFGALRANGGAGRLYVFLGGSFTSGTTYSIPGSMPSSEPDGFVVDAPADAAGMGNSAATPGDFLGADGRSDLVLSASGNAVSSTPGRVYTLAGRGYPTTSSGLVSIVASDLRTMSSGSAGTYGRRVRAIGDYDGNGRVDIAVYNATSAGQVTIFRQTASGFSSSNSFTLSNDAASAGSDLMGNSIGIGYDPFLGRIGDLDGDSMTDLLIGSQQDGTMVGDVALFYGTSTPTALARNSAAMVFGRTDPAPTTLPTDGVAAYVGDLNGDGFNDIMMGDPSYMSGAGRFLVFY